MDALRRTFERFEEDFLASNACRSAASAGRKYAEPPCPLRTDFQRDRDRIIHCKAFRRLKHKTQVFISPEGDHYRTRLTHTLEVAQVARTIARGLRLNEDLTEAIALGHDLGHTPFGHSGEEALAAVYSPGFRHNEQSLRVVEYLEKQSDAYPGLNLTAEVRDGILHHTGPGRAKTLEGQIVALADRIAYINHDIDDAIRGRLITQADLPQDCLAVLGESKSARITRLVIDIITVSKGQKVIGMSPPIEAAMQKLRQYLFEHIYIGSAAKAEENKAKGVVSALYHYYCQKPELLPMQVNNEEPIERVVVDYVAGMTDRYALAEYQRLFLPRSWAF